MLKKVKTFIISEINSNSDYNIIVLDKNIIIILKEIKLIIENLSSNEA